jgi:AcrR family transcriptional regulator
MEVSEIRKEPCRGRGRPQTRSDEATSRLIVDAAQQHFQERGYAGTGMGAVAQSAGVSTKTLYRLFPTKADLFRNVISARIGDFILAIDDEALPDADLATALEYILTAFGKLTLDEGSIAVFRLVLAEGERFPEIAVAFYEGAIRRTRAALATWLDRQRQRGLIAVEDPLEAAGMLRGMMVTELQRAVMMRQRPAPDAAEIAAHARSCVRLFLHGCLARQGEAPQQL